MKSKKSQKNPYEISRNTKNAVKKHQPGKKTRIYPDHTPKSDRFIGGKLCHHKHSPT